MKKAKSMKTGRVAVLPPSIYNNPKRMESGGWVIIEAPEPTPVVAVEPEPVASTAPTMPTVDTLTMEFDTVIEATEPKKPKKQKPTTNE
jgi:hypothetical protein